HPRNCTVGPVVGRGAGLPPPGERAVLARPLRAAAQRPGGRRLPGRAGGLLRPAARGGRGLRTTAPAAGPGRAVRHRQHRGARLLARDGSPTGLVRITVAESAPREVGGLTADPVLVTPGPPPPAGTLVQAIELVGRSVLAVQDATATAEEQTDGTSTTAPRAAAAALDVAAGRPPRLPGGQGLPPRAGTDA